MSNNTSNLRVYLLFKKRKEFEIKEVKIKEKQKDESEIKEEKKKNLQSIQEDYKQYANNFFKYKEEEKTLKKYDPDDECKDNELFYIDGFDLPNYCKPDKLESRLEDYKGNHNNNLKSIMLSNDMEGGRYIIFQKFMSSSLLKKATPIFYKGVYKKAQEDTIILRKNITAVYKDKKLYFKSFSDCKSFADMTQYFKEATEEQIKDFRGQKFINMSDEVWKQLDSENTRKKIAIFLMRIEENDYKLNVEEILKYARQQDIKIESKDKIIFPNDKKEAKLLFEILGDDIYTSKRTGLTYKVTSKRVFSKSK